MKKFEVKLSDGLDMAELGRQLKLDGFELMETKEDGTMVYHQVNEPKFKPFTNEDSYKETKRRIKKAYDFGLTSYSRVALTPWAFSVTVLIGGLLAVAI